MVSGKEADQHTVDEVALANENPGNFLSQRGDEGGAGSDFSGKFFLCHGWEFVDYDEIARKLARGKKSATAQMGILPIFHAFTDWGASASDFLHLLVDQILLRDFPSNRETSLCSLESLYLSGNHPACPLGGASCL